MTMIINLFSKDKTVSNSKMNIILLVVILNIKNIHIVTSQKSKQQIFIGTEQACPNKNEIDGND